MFIKTITNNTPKKNPTPFLILSLDKKNSSMQPLKATRNNIFPDEIAKKTALAIKFFSFIESMSHPIPIPKGVVKE